MTNTDTPPAAPHTVTPDVVADAVTAEVNDLYRVGVSRAQAVDSLHSVANELIQPLITPTPGPAQRSALACADALRAAATVLADHDNDPGRWTPDELQHGDTAATNQAAESPTPTDAPLPPPTDAPPQPGTAMTNTDTPPAAPHTITPDVVADAVTAEVNDLYRVGVSRAQAVDSLHSVANELIQPLITPTPGPAQRSALACADALRAAATVLADHDNDPGRWTPDELQHGDTAATNQAAESPTPTDAPLPPPTDAPPPPPQYPPGLDVSKYVRAPLAPQHPGRT